MDIKILLVTSVSACFELDNKYVYYSDSEYTVIVNEQSTKKSGDQANNAVVYDGQEKRYHKRAEVRPIVLSHMTDKERGIISPSFKTNVFSLFDLQPDTSYRVQVLFDNAPYQTIIDFTTKRESAVLDVKSFFAKGDGKSLDTRSIQNAIDCCPKDGRVYFGPGVYLIAPLTLRSDITYHLAKDAILKGSTNVDDYPMLPGEIQDNDDTLYNHIFTWEGSPLKGYQSTISAHNQDNITIVGQGTIDGNAHNSVWYNDPKNQERARPRLLFFNKCNNTIIHGNHICNSPSWTVHPFFCKGFCAFDIRITGAKDSPNTDGLNPESCDTVSIIGCTISTGDDCIAIKSGKIAMAQRYNTPSRNITIRNCLMRDGHGSIVIGSEIGAGLYDLTVSQCLFEGTDRGLRIKTRRGRGDLSIIKDIAFSNIIMDGVKTPFVINMFYFCDLDGKEDYVQSRLPQPIDSRTPYIGKISFVDIVCKNVEYACAFLYGLPEQPIAEVVFDNVSFDIDPNAGYGYPAMLSNIDKYSKAGIILFNVNKLTTNNVTFRGIVGKDISTSS